MATNTAVATPQHLHKVMGDLKKSNTHRKMLHEQINRGIKAIEEQIIANPTVDAFKTLLLDTMAINRRTKTVVSFQTPKTKYNDETEVDEVVRNTKGEIVWVDDSDEQYITADPKKWRVSIVKKGTVVRIHLTAEYMADLKKDYTNPEVYREVVFYE